MRLTILFFVFLSLFYIYVCYVGLCVPLWIYVIQQEKSGQGAEDQKGPQVVQLVHDTPVPVVRVLRKLPAHFHTWAVPWLCDERHTLTRSDGSEVTVFASKWVPIEKIRKAISHPIDWGVVRPTSRREDKWVFYPPEDQE